MATFGKQKLLLHEVKKKNDLFFILSIVMFILLLITGIGVMTAFQSLNKNLMKNHNKVEFIQKQLESYQESLYRVRNMLHVDLNALNRQLQTMLEEFENIKGNPDKERILLSQKVSEYEWTVNQIKEGILAMSLAIKNQRDEFKLHNEDIVGDLKKEFANDFENLMYFQNETRRDLTKLLYNLNNQTYEAIENLTHYYTEKQQYNNYLTMAMKNFLSLNDSSQHYNNSLNSSESYYYPNITTERSYEINYTTQRQNTTYNGSNVIFPITLPIFKEIQVNNETEPVEPEYFCCEEDLIDLMNHTDSQTNRSNFSGLVLKKAGEIREFVNDAYNKAFEKFKNSFNSKPTITENENKEEKTEEEENNGTPQLMIQGVTAVRQYVGDSLRFVEGKLNSKKLEENSISESNFAEIFRNISSNIELLTQKNTPKSLENALNYGDEMDTVLRKINIMLVEIKKMKRDLEQGKQMFMSLEHMFNYLDYLLEKYLDNAQGSGNASLVRNWIWDFRDARKIYEAIRNMLEEENQTNMQRLSRKQFMRKMKQFLANYHKASSFPGTWQ